jgi:hypothetical protein
MSITLNSKVYNFIGFDPNGVSIYRETSAGVASGFSTLTNKVTVPFDGKTDAVVRWRLTMPIVATVDSECSCAGTVLRTFRFEDGRITIPPGATAAERTDFQVRVTALTATAQYIASLNSYTQSTT